MKWKYLCSHFYQFLTVIVDHKTKTLVVYSTFLWFILNGVNLEAVPFGTELLWKCG
jgi:hypothetical protein